MKEDQLLTADWQNLVREFPQAISFENVKAVIEQKTRTLETTALECIQLHL